MRNTFVNTLVELAKKDRDIELVTGDLGFGVLKPFWEQLPDQFVNAGIAEQNMTTVAAGMALEGKTVFTYSIGTFPLFAASNRYATTARITARTSRSSAWAAGSFTARSE